MINKGNFKDCFGRSHRPLLIAGPCAAESHDQVLETARQLAEHKTITLFRAGIWKPRTQPNVFQGIGEIGLAWLDEVRSRFKLRPCLEVAHPRHVELVVKHGIDTVWIGARTTGSPFAVQELAEAMKGTGLTVLLKNPLSPDLALWLGALERIFKAGVGAIGAIHRGFSSVKSTYLRNSPMWRIPLELRQHFPNLPILCDPSHICGCADLVPGISQAALDMGMDGLMVEVHCEPTRALSDAEQQLTPAAFARMIAGLSLRVPSSADPLLTESLELLRKNLSQLDKEIIEILARRWKIIKQIARVKHSGGIIPFQPEHMKLTLAYWRHLGVERGLPIELLENIYLAIHEASIDEQTRLMNPNCFIGHDGS